MTKMTANQLKGSIEQLTEAMKIIVSVAGIGGDATTQQIMSGISEQRSKLEKRLRDIDRDEKKKLRDLNRLEAEYSELEAKLDAREYKLSDAQIDELREQLYTVYGKIKQVRAGS